MAYEPTYTEPLTRDYPYPDGDGRIEPYAGKGGDRYAQDPPERGTSTRSPKGIPMDQLHNPPSGCLPETVQSIEPYAEKAGPMSARSEDSKQLQDANTVRGVRETDNPHTKVAMSNDSSLDMPGSVDPYANEARTVARRRDADGR